MEKSLREGDTVFIEKCKGYSLSTGDIVAVRNNDEIIIHRYIGFYGTDRLILRGDRNNKFDSPVPVNDLIGKISFLFKGGKFIEPDSNLNLTEDEILICLSIQYLFKAGWKSIGKFNDIDKLHLKLKKEGLSAIVYKTALLFSQEDNIEEFIERLKSDYYENLARCILWMEELEKIEEGLKDIRYIFLKGAWLAKEVYKDPALRRFGDIDILIFPYDIEKVQKILENMGFKASGRFPLELIKKRENSYRSVQFESNDKKWKIHIHVSCANSSLPRYTSFQWNMERLWEDILNDDGEKNYLFHYRFIYCCEHAVKHSFDRLILLRDIYEIIDNYRNIINWETVTEISHKMGIAHRIWLALRFLVARTGIFIPEDFLQTIAPLKENRCMQLFFNFLTGNRRGGDISLILEVNTSSFLSIVNFLILILFPPRVVMATSLGINEEDVNFYHYIRRLFRGMAGFIHWLKN